MRLWSIHPRYLDARGLVALWREGLLAQAVLRGETRGYTRHPQLERFRAQRDPVVAIANYLSHVQAEAQRRGYRFDATKLGATSECDAIAVTRGQIAHEWRHLHGKLKARDPARLADIGSIAHPRAHPCFRVIAGNIEPWERI